jgi:aspartyl-tRNA synthetase
MSEFSYRTHTAGELGKAHVGQTVVLLGWVHRVRNLGGLVFLDVRDRYGITQVVVRSGSAAAGIADRVRPEFVISVRGLVEARSADSVNPKLATGEVEVVADALEILNEAKTPPFPINEEASVSEETRLRYRYLDLRRPALQQNLVLRHKVAIAGARLLRQPELRGNRNTDSDEVDAGRRARLPGAQSRSPGRVLRAPAVAADLQADSHDRRHGSLLPDLQVFP